MSFQKAHVSETRLSNYHKLITTFFKTNFSCLGPKVLSYRNYKNFDESKFLNDLNKAIITFDNENLTQNYNVLSNRFLEVANVHAPLKTKTNKMACKKQRNLCVSLRRECMKIDLKKLKEKGLIPIRAFGSS